jgi:hypothetical protein
MAARSETMNITKKASAEITMPHPTRQGRPTPERFWLQVDRQTKATYTTLEAAEIAGQAIKKAHPIVQVAIYDAVESSNTRIESPNSETPVETKPSES